MEWKWAQEYVGKLVKLGGATCGMFRDEEGRMDSRKCKIPR